ncbi:MAG: SGNH/GDSL hydrolase family protein [Myxococcales bacterium]|nr:SGNH/GDSL hydrolase family protein [Myxococcales bacterium]
MSVRKAAPGLVVLLLMLLVIDGLSFGVGKFLQSRKRIYRVPRPHEGGRSYEEYMKLRDPVLGWPYEAQFGTKDYDETGAKPSPAFPDPKVHPNCITAFGDSFTEGGEVDFEDKWPNQLSRLLGCRVANFGQGGYGTDQGYLRYLKLGTTGPQKVVMLGHMTENVVRILTQDRDLVVGSLDWALKPRFILGAGGEIELVPLPSYTKAEMDRLMGSADPQLAPEHEPFYPGGPAGARRFEFPYTLSLLRSLGDYRIKALLEREDPYLQFYDEGHPLHGTEITFGIMKSFVAKAKSLNQYPLLIIFPIHFDIARYERTGAWPHQGLLRRLDDAGYDYIDFGPHLIEMAKGRDPKSLYKPNGHYNEEVNREIAKVVAARLEELGHPERLGTSTATAADEAP